jgi:hypothetical protein
VIVSKNEMNEKPSDWLRASGDELRLAVKHAALLLLEGYRHKWANLAPVELHRLAWSLETQISREPKVEGGARLMPVPGGFVVLIDNNLPVAKCRTSIAHELVHTLFYSRETRIPTRLFKMTPKEEHFCFDVGRRILAPDWLLVDLGLTEMQDAKAIFASLTRKLGLSKPVAARVMLEDYMLARGVAARWAHRNGQWDLVRGNVYASPSLSRNERQFLRGVAKQWLEKKTKVEEEYRVFGTFEQSGDSAFVLVQVS